MCVYALSHQLGSDLLLSLGFLCVTKDVALGGLTAGSWELWQREGEEQMLSLQPGFPAALLRAQAERKGRWWFTCSQKHFRKQSNVLSTGVTELWQHEKWGHLLAAEHYVGDRAGFRLLVPRACSALASKPYDPFWGGLLV